MRKRLRKNILKTLYANDFYCNFYFVQSILLMNQIDYQVELKSEDLQRLSEFTELTI